jgi:hypothetical protein
MFSIINKFAKRMPLIRRRTFSTIVTKHLYNKPSCLKCEHYNLEDSKCYAIKNIPILATDSRKNDCRCSCGPAGKLYKYIGPSFAQDNEHIKENVYLSVTSLVFCKLFVFEFYPPYSMVICVLPLSLTAFYGLLFLEQTYMYKKMEKEERQRLSK